MSYENVLEVSSLLGTNIERLAIFPIRETVCYYHRQTTSTDETGLPGCRIAIVFQLSKVKHQLTATGIVVAHPRQDVLQNHSCKIGKILAGNIILLDCPTPLHPEHVYYLGHLTVRRLE